MSTVGFRSRAREDVRLELLPDQRRSVVAQIAAHELRHDAQVARRLVEGLMAAPDGADATRRRIEQQLHRAIERLEQDIDRLLVHHGGDLDTLERRPTNLASLVHRVVQAHPTGRQPVDVDVTPVVANVDPVKVERILDNLLANALLHTPPDCPVRVGVSLEPGGVVLFVEDHGPGLSPDDRDALLDAGESPPAGGMGLWIVVRFARLHQGDVRIDVPAPGHGARFTVWLPAVGGP